MSIDIPRFISWMDQQSDNPPPDSHPRWAMDTFAHLWCSNATLLAPFFDRSPWLLDLVENLNLGDPCVWMEGHGLVSTDVSTLGALDGGTPSLIGDGVDGAIKTIRVLES